jgi:hypothetical protein
MIRKSRKQKRLFFLLSCLVIWSFLIPNVSGQKLEQFEGRITRINDREGTLVVNGLTLDASDFELSDLQAGYWVMGDFIREKGKLRLVDIEVIK